MDMHELVLANRSYRNFNGSRPVTRESALKWIDNARLTMSSVNIQPIKYFVSTDAATNALIRPHTRWAGLLKDFNGPEGDCNPTCYIVVCVDGSVQNATVERFAKDIGIVSQTIMLSATEDGFGGCMIGSFDRDELHELLKLPGECVIGLVLALGTPNEKIVLEPLQNGQPSAYYRDEKGVHHVPKRALEDILL